jgi:hypothetical protein
MLSGETFLGIGIALLGLSFLMAAGGILISDIRDKEDKLVSGFVKFGLVLFQGILGVVLLMYGLKIPT